jgi:nucleotide-binding universal stress UspA family protein
MTKQRWIAVGIDGSEGSRAAAQWAALEARRTGAGVRLVHIFDDHVPMAGFYAAVYPAGSVEGHVLAARTVRRAKHAVQHILDDDHIEQVVLRGDRRAGLLRAAADADLMVLGDVAHPAHHHLITGSIIGPIAAHSPTPVVVVPAG